MPLEEANHLWMCLAPCFAKIGAMVHPVGSLRRRRLTVGDLDLVVVAWSEVQVQAVIDALLRHGYETNYLKACRRGRLLKQQTFVWPDGRQHGKNYDPWPPHVLDVHYCDEASLGAQLIQWTGSMVFYDLCRARARELGMRLRENGLFGHYGQTLIARDEAHILERLDLSEHLDPTRREMGD